MQAIVWSTLAHGKKLSLTLKKYFSVLTWFTVPHRMVKNVVPFSLLMPHSYN